MRWVGRVVFAALLRGLAAMGGATSAYGATAMFTTSGIFPPNPIVLAGIAMCAVVALLLVRTDRSIRGIWPALLIAAVPYTLYAWGSFGVEECPQPHPPITATYFCAPIGTHAIGVVAPVLALAAFALLVADVRALARGPRPARKASP